MKQFLLLIFNTLVAAGIYFFAVYKMQSPLVMTLYMLAAVFSLCLYMFLFLHHNNEIGKAKMKGGEVPAELYQKRKKIMKNVICFLFPFLFTVLVDYIYLLIFVDNPYLDAFLNSLK